MVSPVVELISDWNRMWHTWWQIQWINTKLNYNILKSGFHNYLADLKLDVSSPRSCYVRCEDKASAFGSPVFLYSGVHQGLQILGCWLSLLDSRFYTANKLCRGLAPMGYPQQHHLLHPHGIHLLFDGRFSQVTTKSQCHRKPAERVGCRILKTDA